MVISPFQRGEKWGNGSEPHQGVLWKNQQLKQDGYSQLSLSRHASQVARCVGLFLSSESPSFPNHFYANCLLDSVIDVILDGPCTEPGFPFEAIEQ
jgi:hypothetical protein